MRVGGHGSSGPEKRLRPDMCGARELRGRGEGEVGVALRELVAGGGRPREVVVRDDGEGPTAEDIFAEIVWCKR